MRIAPGLISACIALAACACAGNPQGNDLSTEDVPDDGISGPRPGPTVLAVDDGVDPITQWSFADTPVGARAGVTVFVINTGDTATQALVASVAGGHGFTIDAAASTCGGAALAPGARCSVTLGFAPASPGSCTARLRVTGGGGALDLALHGAAVAATTGIVADAATLNFGAVEVASSRQLDVQVSNPGTSSITLSPRTVTAGFTITDSCPATLGAGAACTVHVTFRPAHAGVLTGALTIPSSDGTLNVRLRGVGARRVTVSLDGTGAGRVTSTPAGIDCGTTCSALFTGAVTLTAAADPDHFFAGWGGDCGTHAKCRLPAQGAATAVTAVFQPPTAKRIRIAVAGEAAGFVYLIDDSISAVVTCTASCTTHVAPGAQVTLLGFTPSTFSGWTGACTTTDHGCNLGAVTADRAATVTFDRDEREVATVIPRAPVTGLTMTPDGNLVVADAFGVSKLTLAGDVVWTRPIEGGAAGLASDAAGNIYGAGAPGLFALSPSGALRWARPIAVAPYPLRSIQSTVSASSDGTVIGAHLRDGVHVVDGSGSDRFVRTVPTADGMAVAPDGTVAVGTDSVIPPLLDVVRFTASGATLPPLSPLPGDRDASLVYDAQGFLCAHTTFGGFAHVSRTSPDLTTVFTTFEATHFAVSPPGGVVITSSGEVVSVRGADENAFATGVLIEAYSPTGTLTWTHRKPADSQFFFLLDNGVLPSAVATDNNHHLAIGGVYN
ncbi:MAG TPA: choice-of-anchor D domain-containing protein, partial [Kofleriaceae bacterium]